MVNQQLLDYVKQQLAAGVPKDDIKKAMALSGWPTPDAEEALNAAEGKAAPEPPQQGGNTGIASLNTPRGPVGWWMLGIVALLVLLGVVVWYFLPVVRPLLFGNIFPEEETALATVQKYENVRYGYSFEYPNDWVIEPERQIVDEVNQILSEVTIHDSTNTHKVSVLVNKKEWLLKHETLFTASTTVNGSIHTAYLFPEGYECRMADPEAEDCSFFMVPIFNNGVWHQLYASGEAQTVSPLYQDIFSSFAITPVSIE